MDIELRLLSEKIVEFAKEQIKVDREFKDFIYLTSKALEETYNPNCESCLRHYCGTLKEKVLKYGRNYPKAKSHVNYFLSHFDEELKKRYLNIL